MTRHSHFIDGKWVEGSGEQFESTDPASGETIWSGHAAAPDEINQAVFAARRAFQAWSATSIEHRANCLHTFRKGLLEKTKYFAESLSRETGKPLWESRTEVMAMLSKIDLSIEAYQKRRFPETHHRSDGRTATRFKPHGVVVVLGPFNLPGHLSNAHIVPALLAGNTVVFKPSEQTPLVAQELSQLWESAALPPGTFNLVQGDRKAGELLTDHPDIDGLFFTGGYKAGLEIHQKYADHPKKILALELGGNNPLAIYKVSNLDAAAYWTIQSAFITSGQRCTCARRLILPEGSDGNAFLERFATLTKSLHVGAYTSKPEPFMGPVISNASAERLLAAQDELIHKGGRCLLQMSTVGGNGSMLSPGIIDVTDVNDRQDVELFGPLLQVIRVPDFDALVAEANHTSYGLSAGLFSDDADHFETFYHHVNAGIINWNCPITGASGTLPFGGIGRSGNHRPSGYYASDYCSYPIASIEHDKLEFPDQLTPGIEM